MDYQNSIFDVADNNYYVREISKKETYYLLLNVHYARRLPPMSYAYGLFFGMELVGVITYGMPASPSLCVGVCGKEYRENVLELNRLCLVNNKKNEASMLVGKSLKMLPPRKIIVSYADTNQDHLGIVYQATNFIYTGITKARKEWAVKGLEKMHTKALSNTVSGMDNPLQALKDKYGDDFYQRERSQKHRYVMFTGNKTDKKELKLALKYPEMPYPKGKE